MNRNYQLGLLHLVHILVNVDGCVDEREKGLIQRIADEEQIHGTPFAEFEKKVAQKKEQDIYQEGISLLNDCSEEEKLCAFVHLYRLAEADSSVHVKEVRFLLYAVKVTRIEFEDVVLSARLARAPRTAA